MPAIKTSNGRTPIGQAESIPRPIMALIMPVITNSGSSAKTSSAIPSAMRTVRVVSLTRLSRSPVPSAETSRGVAPSSVRADDWRAERVGRHSPAANASGRARGSHRSSLHRLPAHVPLRVLIELTLARQRAEGVGLP